MPIAATLIASMGLVILSALCLTISKTATSGTLHRNSAIGIRTSETKKSDAAWESGHREAAPILKVTGLIIIPLAAFLLISSFFADEFLPLATGALAYVITIGGSVWATAVAHKAAKEVNTRQADHPH